MIRALMAWVALSGASVSVHFVDRTAPAGITAVLHSGSMEKKWIMEANGGGVAVFDYDRDGQMDLLLTGGASMGSLQALMKSDSPRPRMDGVFLYRNKGDGTFTDVTKAAGLTNPFWGCGANVADYDGDGFVDILLTNIGRDLLFRNQGDGTFTDVSRKAGLSGQTAWHTGSAFLDYDSDGDLDLYIAGYVRFSELSVGDTAPVCRYLELPVFCGPLNLPGEADIFYRNDGGTFSEATAAVGLAEKEARYGFTVVATDLNADGMPDLMVANDSGPNYLYLNNGKGQFVESALISGVAYNADGKAQANMGIAIGDYDNDGDLDLLTTTFSEDHYPLFQQSSPGVFEDVSASLGLVRTTSSLLGWACGFSDLDNDGWRDLWLANGHVYPTIKQAGRTAYHQPLLVLPNKRGKFGEPVLAAPATRSWRSGAAGDFNNDGRIDLIAAPAEGEPVLLENRTSSKHHWIGIDAGMTAGTAVYVEACKQKWFDTVRSGGSYVSAEDPRRHFGLGDCATVDQISIHWPSGKKQMLKNPAIDRYHRVP